MSASAASSRPPAPPSPGGSSARGLLSALDPRGRPPLPLPRLPPPTPGGGMASVLNGSPAAARSNAYMPLLGGRPPRRPRPRPLPVLPRTLPPRPAACAMAAGTAPPAASRLPAPGMPLGRPIGKPLLHAAALARESYSLSWSPSSWPPSSSASSPSSPYLPEEGEVQQVDAPGQPRVHPIHASASMHASNGHAPWSLQGAYEGEYVHVVVVPSIDLGY